MGRIVRWPVKAVRHMLRISWPACLIVLLVFSSGILAGSVSAGGMQEDKSKELRQYVYDFIKNAGSIDFESEKMAGSAMTGNLITVALIYVLGLSVIGMPVTLAVLFVRGYVLGYAVGFLTRDLSIEGILLAAASILPHNILYIPAICVASAYSIMFCTVMIKRNFNTEIRVWPRFLTYNCIMVGVTACTVVAGLIEGYITPSITKIVTGAITSYIPGQ